ncbi:MAG: glycosyltransferase family 87 protein [Aliidongia sp.]
MRRARSAGDGWRKVAIRVWQLVFALTLLTHALTGAIDYDEDQYVAAGVMARHLMLYRDFIYLQSPVYALLLAGLFTLTGGYYLLAARALTGVLAIMIFGLTFRLVRRYGAGSVLATMLASIALLSPFLDQPTATARNDLLPLALFLCGLLVYLDAAARPRRWAILAGFCIGLAIDAKITYIFMPLVLLLHAAWPGTGRRRQLVPFAAGLTLAALPGLYYLAMAPTNFLYDLLELHRTASRVWYQRQGVTELLGPANRLATLILLLSWGTNLSLVMLTAGLAVIGRWRRTVAGGLIGLLGLLIGATLLAGFQPAVSYPMYYAASAPLLAALAAALYARIARAGPVPLAVPLLLTLATLPALPVLWHRLADLPELTSTSTWPGLEVHRQAAALHEMIGAAGLEGEVATLFPIHALDAASVMPEFASGPFFFRTADLLSPARITALHGAGAETIESLFARDPPAAILGGFASGQWHDEMDASLDDYARRHSYRPISLEGSSLWPAGTWLYLRH